MPQLQCRVCGRLISEEAVTSHPDQAEPCPSCGSIKFCFLDVLSPKGDVQVATPKLDRAPNESAEDQLDRVAAYLQQGEYLPALALAHAACARKFRQALTSAFAAHDLEVLQDLLLGIKARVPSNRRTREVYTVLSEDSLERTVWWRKYTESYKHYVRVRKGKMETTQPLAEQAYEMAIAFVNHLRTGLEPYRAPALSKAA